MTVIDLNQARQERAEFRAAIEAVAHRVVEVSNEYGQQLATYAHGATGALGKFDRDLMHTAERFILRRGLTRSRRTWCEEYGPALGRQYAKMAEPIVRLAYWSRLDEVDPHTIERGGQQVQLVRGWLDYSKWQAAQEGGRA